MTQAVRPGDVLAGRYRLVDLLSESGNGRFWRAHDNVLERHVALHCIAEDDERAEGLTVAARRSATVIDRRLLRVLDADRRDGMAYVVNEWGEGSSLDIVVGNDGPMPPRRAAWVVSEVAASIAVAHEARIAHGRLVPETVLLDHSGGVRIIGCCVDAALRGLPPDRITQDVGDLGALLYYCLTGRWAGGVSSAVRFAPRSQDRWLRPRQVRAGVPRVLDGICDAVLNPFTAAPPPGPHNVLTAAGLAEALRDYVGDPHGLAEASLTPGSGNGAGAGVLAVPGPRVERDPQPEPAPEPPPEPEPTPEPEATAEPEPEPAPASEPEPTPEPAPGDAEAGTAEPEVGTATRTVPVAPLGAPSPEQRPDAVEQPTEAGMPVFDDAEDEVSWFSARQQPPPPPPPLEEPPERPLFAPTPPEGEPVRRPRPHATGPREYWPWDTATGAGTGTGSGVIPVTEDEPDDEPVPGRSAFRLAAAVGAGLLLVLAVLVAFNLGRGKTVLGTDPDPSPSPSQSQRQTASAPQPIEIAGVRDFDPQGDPPEENPDQAGLAVDGDAATAWATQTYFDQLGPTGLKTGLGLVVDLGTSQDVAEVDLRTLGSPVDVSYYLTDDDPSAVADLDPVATGTVTGDRLQTTLEEPARGRYLVVWITSLVPVDDGFRADVAEVEVSG